MMLDIQNAQIEAYQRNLLGNSMCMEYLADRRVSLDAIHTYGVGYYDTNIYDSYNQRMLFPIRDEYGWVHAYQGRAMFDWKEYKVPKYWHGSYEKSRVVYGLYEALRLAVDYSTVVITEGPFDVMAGYDAGIPTVAMLGTTMSINQALILRRYVKHVLVWSDNDKAGLAAYKRLEELLPKAGLTCEKLPYAARYNSKDPSEVWVSANGIQDMREIAKYVEMYAGQR